MIDIEKEKIIFEKAKKDINAFGDLYDLYVEKIYSYVMYLVKNHNDAEDIVSETFEKAMLNIDKFEYRGYTFGSWLYKIARNLVYDRSKKRKLTSFEDVKAFIDSDDYNPENIASKDEMNKYLLNMLSELKADQREIIYLRYIKCYSIKEVCDITGKTQDSVKSLAKRAMSNLRDIVKSKKK